MSDAIGIKVAVRCRPFVKEDKLGVKLTQVDDDNGEVELLNSDYSTTRFPFSYAWWSGYGYQKRLQGDNMADADAMTLVDQLSCYNSCGLKIKADLIEGDAVVLFAYGLSGSGKTFTVFGPDAVDAPEAWFKWTEPHDMWGIFPRLAYDLFKEKSDGWRISMKYFQNVVDIVRDLMSPNGEERSYKSGMRADEDGFMDIEWCDEVVIKSWDELRSTFQVANGRKAIAPTQFNPMSTRGHCIMTLEVETPNPDVPGMKRRGRLYVCDLAGTEPAGDIVYANYDKKTFDDGSFEYEYVGPHRDESKTMELRNQGMKINLSLSEMAQFFMKMADAVKRKRLKPGMSIPGCNSFFLCRYLKKTMLQAKTYLFAAIRPEVEYHRYTFSTLNFSKNASVVQLKPKKATVVCSPAEKKLMEELEEMKAKMEQLKAEAIAEELDDAAAEAKIADLQAQLAGKQQDLESEVVGVPSARHEALAARVQEQREGYAKRGISLAEFEADTTSPYFISVDEDPFRNGRFMYILSKSEVKFGDNGDIQPFSYSIIDDHCVVKVTESGMFLVGGKGEVFHNGAQVTEGQEVKLELLDRVCMGEDLMILRHPANEAAGATPMSPDNAFSEYREGLVASRKGASAAANNVSTAVGGGISSAELEAERQKLLDERKKWEKERAEMQTKAGRMENATVAVDNLDETLMKLVPKTQLAKKLVDLLNRVYMTFEVVLERGVDHVVQPMVRVENSAPPLTMILEPDEFSEKVKILNEEVTALKWKDQYEIPECNDPLFLFFDDIYLLGTATTLADYLILREGTGGEDWEQDIKNNSAPYQKLGTMESEWTPLAGPEPSSWETGVSLLDNPSKAIGKPWTAKLDITVAHLPVRCHKAYIEYDFLGVTYTTEVVEQASNSPRFAYSHIHHVDSVSPEFVDFLRKPLEFNVFVCPFIDAPADKLGTSNKIVMESIKTGKPKGYDEAGASDDINVARAEIVRLKKKICDLEEELANCEEDGHKGGCFFCCCCTKPRRKPKIHAK